MKTITMNPATLLATLISVISIGVLASAQNSGSPRVATSSLKLVQLTSTSHTANAQDTQLLCSLSGFFSLDSDEILTNKISLDGRGLLNCKSEQGFTTELPVLLTAEIDYVRPQTAPPTELAFSLNTTTFVVPRETTQLEDSYQIRESSTSRVPSSEASYFLRGEKRDIVIDSKLSSTTTSISAVKLTGLKIKFDDSAPDLRTSF